VYVGSEVLTTVVINNYISCDITPCSPFESQRMFRRNMPPFLGLKNKPSVTPAKAVGNEKLYSYVGFFLGLCIEPEIEATCSSETLVDFDGLHGVISEKIYLFNI
jgi:hypothetical protein